MKDDFVVTKQPELPPVYPGMLLKDTVLPALVVRLGRFRGKGPEPRIQQAHDLWQAERKLGDELVRIPMHQMPLSLS